jgi:AbrB family looped-hinge helix DNA binding protein
MNTISEIDKAGRVVVPKRLRDALHLVAGTQLIIRQEGDRIVIQPHAASRGLYMKRGTLVYDAGVQPAADVVEWIAEDREKRTRHLSGDGSKR